MHIPSTNFWSRLEDKQYRHAYAIAQFKRLVPFQISSLRKLRGWSQQELAEKAGVTQGVISRAEDPDYGNLAANTILKIANGFDVVFVGKFVPYSELEKLVNHLSEKDFVLNFELENAIRNSAAPDSEIKRDETPNNVIPIDRRAERALAEHPQKEGGLNNASSGHPISASASLR
jgi:transcriptional regulator with XRE-family HTH domain